MPVKFATGSPSAAPVLQILTGGRTGGRAGGRTGGRTVGLAGRQRAAPRASVAARGLVTLVVQDYTGTPIARVRGQHARETIMAVLRLTQANRGRRSASPRALACAGTSESGRASDLRARVEELHDQLAGAAEQLQSHQAARARHAAELFAAENARARRAEVLKELKRRAFR